MVIYQSLHPGHSCCSPVAFPGSCCSCSPLLGMRFYDRDVVKSMATSRSALAEGTITVFQHRLNAREQRGRGPIGGRLEPSLCSVDTWANAQDGRQHQAVTSRRRVIRGPWPQMGSFRAIPLIGGHQSKSSRGSPLSCSDELLIGVCAASAERTFNLLQHRLSTKELRAVASSEVFKKPPTVRWTSAQMCGMVAK